jgi:adenine phosphoribosyltransferase
VIRKSLTAKHQFNCEPLKELVRTVPDLPKPGILFYDITTLLKDKTGFAQMIDALAAHYIADEVDLVLGIEARGFIFGPALAYRLNAGFVPVRKPRKLPAKTGGTMQATVQLVRQLGGEIAGLGFAVELDFLKGRDKFPEYDVYSLLHYDE